MIDNEAISSIERLHKLKEEGVITAEDFEEAKARLLKEATVPAKPKKVAASSSKAPLPANGDHLGWMLLAVRRYAQFEGRSTRKEFWMFLLLTNLVSAGLFIIMLADTNVLGLTGPVGDMALILLALGVLGVIIPFIAVQVRRFHDQGRSGWFALLNLIPYLGVLITLGFMFVQGQDGENEFGPDPRS